MEVGYSRRKQTRRACTGNMPQNLAVSPLQTLGDGDNFGKRDCDLDHALQTRRETEERFLHQILLHRDWIHDSSGFGDAFQNMVLGLARLLEALHP